MKEDMIREWFSAWFNPEWNKFHEIFEDNIYYSESWGSEYIGIYEIEKWFMNWHKHSELITWKIKQFIHSDNYTIVEWYFCCKDSNKEHGFDGCSIIEWGQKGTVLFLTFICVKSNTWIICTTNDPSVAFYFIAESLGID